MISAWGEVEAVLTLRVDGRWQVIAKVFHFELGGASLEG